MDLRVVLTVPADWLSLFIACTHARLKTSYSCALKHPAQFENFEIQIPNLKRAMQVINNTKRQSQMDNLSILKTALANLINAFPSRPLIFNH